jgi:hypothetical protein
MASRAINPFTLAKGVVREKRPREEDKPAPAKRPPAPPSAASAGPNAFQRMMKAAAEGPYRATFRAIHRSDGKTDTFECEWMGGKADDAFVPSWEAEVTLRANATHPKGAKVLVQTNVPSGSAGGAHISAIPRRTSSFSPSQLKSILQKAVRRGLVEAAVGAASELLATTTDPTSATNSTASSEWGSVQLARRLPVVMLEDCAASPAFCLLAWLTLAVGKGYVPGAAHGAAMLHIVRELAAAPFRDALPAEATTLRLSADSSVRASKIETSSTALFGVTSDEWANASRSEPSMPIQAFKDCDGLPPGPRTLCCSMLARAAMGGMHHDVDMCRGYASLWAARALATPSGECSVYNVANWVVPDSQWSTLLTGTPTGSWCSWSMPTPSGRDSTALAGPRVPVAGIDPHCSNVTNDLSNAMLGGQSVLQLLERLLAEFAASTATARDCLAQLPADPVKVVESLAGRCSWAMSGSLNARPVLWGPRCPPWWGDAPRRALPDAVWPDGSRGAWDPICKGCHKQDEALFSAAWERVFRPVLESRARRIIAARAGK